MATVGIERSVGLFKQAALEDQLAELETGALLTVLESRQTVLKVKTSDAAQGWVRRCWICSPEEFKRRESANCIPRNAVCIGAEGDERFLYGGALSIQNNRPAVRPGDAFWLDPHDVG